MPANIKLLSSPALAASTMVAVSYTHLVGAIGKGSGMIAPNMATMLAFYTTDAAVSPILLEKALKTVVPGTYNQMSVDLDLSLIHI